MRSHPRTILFTSFSLLLMLALGSFSDISAQKKDRGERGGGNRGGGWQPQMQRQERPQMQQRFEQMRQQRQAPQQQRGGGDDRRQQMMQRFEQMRQQRQAPQQQRGGGDDRRQQMMQRFEQMRQQQGGRQWRGNDDRRQQMMQRFDQMRQQQGQSRQSRGNDDRRSQMMQRFNQMRQQQVQGQSGRRDRSLNRAFAPQRRQGNGSGNRWFQARSRSDRERPDLLRSTRRDRGDGASSFRDRFNGFPRQQDQGRSDRGSSDFRRQRIDDGGRRFGGQSRDAGSMWSSRGRDGSWLQRGGDDRRSRNSDNWRGRFGRGDSNIFSQNRDFGNDRESRFRDRGDWSARGDWNRSGFSDDRDRFRNRDGFAWWGNSDVQEYRDGRRRFGRDRFDFSDFDISPYRDQEQSWRDWAYSEGRYFDERDFRRNAWEYNQRESWRNNLLRSLVSIGAGFANDYYYIPPPQYPGYYGVNYDPWNYNVGYTYYDPNYSTFYVEPYYQAYQPYDSYYSSYYYEDPYYFDDPYDDYVTYRVFASNSVGGFVSKVLSGLISYGYDQGYRDGLMARELGYDYEQTYYDPYVYYRDQPSYSTTYATTSTSYYQPYLYGSYEDRYGLSEGYSLGYQDAFYGDNDSSYDPYYGQTNINIVTLYVGTTYQISV